MMKAVIASETPVNFLPVYMAKPPRRQPSSFVVEIQRYILQALLGP
jgi:hypothetical protein